MGARKVCVVEVHHTIPQHLLRLREKADAAELDGAGIEAWLEDEHEALRYGVAPDVGSDELAALIDASTVELGREEHRARHASDFVRWGLGAGEQRWSVTGERGSRSWLSDGGAGSRRLSWPGPNRLDPRDRSSDTRKRTTDCR